MMRVQPVHNHDHNCNNNTTTMWPPPWYKCNHDHDDRPQLMTTMTMTTTTMNTSISTSTMMTMMTITAMQRDVTTVHHHHHPHTVRRDSIHRICQPHSYLCCIHPPSPTCGASLTRTSTPQAPQVTMPSPRTYRRRLTASCAFRQSPEAAKQVVGARSRFRCA